MAEGVSGVSSLAPSTPRAWDGKTFGIWPIPGPDGWQALTLASEPDGGTIEGTIGGQVVVTLPKPWGQRNSSSQASCTVDGHEIVLYAESWDLGETVLCDVFVDGYSSTTHGPVSVIVQRLAAVTPPAPRTRLPVGPYEWAASVIWLVPMMCIWKLVDDLPRYAHGTNVPVAIVGGVSFDLVAGFAAWTALSRMAKRHLIHDRVIAAGIYAATFAGVAAAYGVALVIARG